MAKIGFVGLGNMGGPMARNLVRAGHEVKGFDLSEEALNFAVQSGVTAAPSVAEAASGVDVLISMLPVGQNVRQVFLDNGVLAAARPLGGETFLGDWRCRTIKAGGRLLPLTVYGWFTCRVGYGEDGLVFRKLTGSQRTAGTLWPIYPESGEGFPARWIYLGAGFYGDLAAIARSEPSGDRDQPGPQYRRLNPRRPGKIPSQN